MLQFLQIRNTCIIQYKNFNFRKALPGAVPGYSLLHTSLAYRALAGTVPGQVALTARSSPVTDLIPVQAIRVQAVGVQDCQSATLLV